MDCYLTSSFMTRFPERLRQSLLEPNCFYDLYKSISNNCLIAGTDLLSFMELLESQKTSENEIIKVLSGLEAAGKLQTIKKTDEMPDFVRQLNIRKSVIEKIGPAFSKKADMVVHDKFEIQKWKTDIMMEGGKPVIDNHDLESGQVAFLFSEKSETLKIGADFSWDRILSPYIFPFKKVRILDPYFYANFKSIRFGELLNTLSSKSKGGLDVEIISDSKVLERNNRNSRREKDLMDEVIESMKQNIPNMMQIKLYSQKWQGKDFFHARVLWTDFWALHFDRGFDFLESEGSSVKVKRLNMLFQTGKYASKNNVYHEISDNWDSFLQHSRLYHSINL